jgi:signal transduction histidine kinase
LHRRSHGFGDHLYGYLIVCAHTQKALKRTQEDLDFLSTLASQVAHAVQFSNSFKDLEDQNTQLRHLDELKDSFITITSHQLRTPLSIVKWILSILQSDKELAHMPEQNHLINQAYSSNERLIHVVNELLNVSRVQDGKLPCSPQLIDVVPLLRDLANSATKMGADHHISVTAEIEPGLPLLCLDPLLTKQLFQDLMDNALDYNQDNGWIHLSAKREAGKLVIVFVNSGMGIGEEDSRKVFDQFFRGPEAMRQQPNGNGLGLYLARAIVDSHQGKIDFKSSPGESTTFTISLPIPE